MQRTLLPIILLLLVACTTGQPVSDTASVPGQGEDQGKIVVYRDTWGVPHIYAPSVEDGLYAMGRAQAEDRPEQLLINVKMALGEYASIAGKEAVNHDITHRMFDHYGVSKRTFDDQDEVIKQHLQSYTQGVIDHYAAHPGDVPDCWGKRQLDVYMFSAFARYFLYNWSINEAYGDLRRGGINPGFTPRRHASNQWVVGPERSASGNPILLIDPHLGWWGVTRFWEFRIHAGDLVGSGVTLPGGMYIGLGHNEHLAWAMTTGGPDTADIFELTLNPTDHTLYRYDDSWRKLEKTSLSLDVRNEGTRQVTIHRSHHGPIIAWQMEGVSPKAYAARIAYDESVDPGGLYRSMNFGRDYRAVVQGLESLGTYPQNIMAADTSGNIYYHRAGRVPVRAKGYDWSRPVDGSTSRTEWQGFHPAANLLQILNPAHGYMQNCNIPPDAMMVKGPFRIDDYLPSIFSSAQYGPSRSGWIGQRGARALEILHNDDAVTIQEALAYAVDVKPYGVERWLTALQTALAGVPLNSEQKRAKQELAKWNGELRRDSGAALKYAYFKFALATVVAGGDYAALRSKIDKWYLIVVGEEPPPVKLTEAESEAIASAFTRAIEIIREQHGGVDAVYGDVLRVGRDDRSWPVGGGGDDYLGLTTLRTMGYGPPRRDFTRWGQSGQTSTQVVELSIPIKSWIYLPVGQSDRPDSPHYDDQAERAFSKRQLKPSWWRSEELADHIESRRVYQR